MKRLGTLCGLLIVLALLTPLYSAEKPAIVDVKGPTIIAFFSPVVDTDLKADADTRAALDDFRFFLGQARRPLKNRRLELREIYARSFTIRIAGAETKFEPTKDVGYYLVAPGKKPRVEYGIMCDADLLQVADEYFGNAKH